MLVKAFQKDRYLATAAIEPDHAMSQNVATAPEEAAQLLLTLQPISE